MKTKLYSFVLGLAVLSLLAVISYALNRSDVWDLGLKWLGFGALALCLVLSGTMVSGDRMRANAAAEPREDRNARWSAAGNLFAFSLPFLAALAYMSATA